MSTYPRLEARVSALERQQTILNARIEEVTENMTISIKHLSDDMTASFDQLVEYHIRTEGQIDTRFNQVDARFNQVDTRLDKIEATMATKEDLAAMENRLLDTLKQMLATINTQRPPSE
jgi:chaperonin cofactor prefoldin